ncbi:hypothetical protein GBAR_LOCUS14506 [Geodia barretti]|uniref:Uncharacterized protein n=1 Tax=Geodia barretti TaxID=519541 RepID=A0AA35WKR2_GEOBA|nr:hypothetical protein GBAR_LOCUS14506 [Geodia barretti]
MIAREKSVGTTHRWCGLPQSGSAVEYKDVGRRLVFLIPPAPYSSVTMDQVATTFEDTKQS